MTKLKQIRKEQGLSQNQAARLVGVSQRAWARWEAGKEIPEPILRRFYAELGLDYPLDNPLT